MRGHAVQSGELELLYLQGSGRAAAPWLHLDADRAYGYLIETTYAYTGVVDVDLPDPQDDGVHAIASETEPLQGLRLWSVQEADAFEVHVFPWAGNASMKAHMPDADLASLEAASLSTDGIEPAVAGAEGGDPCNTQDFRTFTPRVVSGDVLRTSLLDAVYDLDVQGDFVIEVRGISFEGRSRAGDAAFETRETTQQELGGSKLITERILRLFVEDGRMMAKQKGGETKTAMAFGSSFLDGRDGTLALDDAVGTSILGTGDLDHGVLVLEAPYAVALAPADERIELTGFTTAPSATVTPHDPLPWLWGAIGLVAAGIVAWLATRGRPDLRSIEVALESGHYGKAARLSTRVLRKDPLQESAHLSRAIAWSRAGHPGRVLRAVGRFLERHDPTDGTLHYVLGLAHKDLGDDEAARQAIAEAVDRTPSLLMEVEPILRPARAFHSDAQAYT